MELRSAIEDAAAREEAPTAEAPAAPKLRGLSRLRFWRSPWVKAFWNRAYQENVTGMAAMVAYNLMLAIFPFVLLVLFVAGRILSSESVEATILNDLQQLFPDVEQDALQRAVDRIRDSSTTIGVFAIIGGIWIGASFWGAMDTAFGRIYHVESRSWLAQKRFALVMLLVVALFLAASVVIPTLESTVLSTADDLPFGLSNTSLISQVVLLSGALLTTFLIACVIYWATPKGHMPWHSVWPGALFFTAIMGVVNWAYPVYLGSVSNLSQFGGTVGFVLIALLWFYAIALTLLAGAVINSIRHERYDTGTLPING
jgi:YihY family inner membrane protein